MPMAIGPMFHELAYILVFFMIISLHFSCIGKKKALQITYMKFLLTCTLF